MQNLVSRVYLFVHIIWSVKGGEPKLSKPIRTVLFSSIKKQAAEKGISLITMNGTDDHVHCLLQLHATQQLSQVVRLLQQETAAWINESGFMKETFEWGSEWMAYSVSPSSYQQVFDYIQKQEEYHKTKTLEQELAVFDKMPVV